MFPHELMYGNFVYHPASGMRKAHTDVFRNADKHSAIPLTAIWLTRLGFERKSGRESYEWVYKKLLLFEIGESRFCVQIADSSFYIIHLHQLQNLYFALTGEDLHFVDQIGAVKFVNDYRQ